MADSTAGAPAPETPLHKHTCKKCERDLETRTSRLPKGWKNINGDPVCNRCVKDTWVPRGITIRVAAIRGRVVGRGTAQTLEPVEGFLRYFHDAWRLATDLANWTQQEIIRRDVRRLPAMTTLPAYESPNLYRVWNEVAPPEIRTAWDRATGTAATIVKAVEDVWRGRNRLQVVWHGRSRAAVFNYPYPWPVREQDYKIGWLQTPGGRVPTLSVTMAGARYLLELDRSPDYRRQLADFDRLVRGEAIRGDVRLVPLERGGRVVGVKAVIFGRFLRTPVEAVETREAQVTTQPSALLTVTTPDRDPWTLNAQHLRGLVSCHRKWLERRSADLKHEWRWPAATRRRFVRNGQAAISRNKGRVKCEVQKACAAVVGLAVRQRCGVLVYDDRCRDFLESWPWYTMRQRMQTVCASYGIRFHHVGPDDDRETDADVELVQP